MSTYSKKHTFLALALLAAASVTATGCAAATELSDDTIAEDADGEGAETGTATSELRIPTGLGADGDVCTVRTTPDGGTVSGKEKDGECCSDTDPDDCVIILKPMPSVRFYRR